MTKLNMVQALNKALHNEMEKDEKVIVLGEDVGKEGGVFRVTEGLQQKFGPNRAMDTPLSEAGIVGVSVGMAAFGLRPVAEIQFNGFVYYAFNQIINHIARLRNRSRGRFTSAFVIRIPSSGGIRALEHHSESLEAHFVHTAGLKVVMPSTPYDAKGLLISSIRDNDPIMFLEPIRLYRSIKEEVPEEEYSIPIGQAKVVKEGADVTVITYGTMVPPTLQAVEELGKKNINAEVIDLRTLWPLDDKTIIDSVKKTGRVAIVHEAPRCAGLGAELVARINERAFLSLEAPIARITGYDVPMPLPKLEDYFIPDSFRIMKGIESVVKF